ncbi:MAG: LbtU family siderophore porin [Gammaproteobacteria bacterium]|nr:LbtU family siderophore porin [Gammaproteobacteria bacterium]
MKTLNLKYLSASMLIAMGMGATPATAEPTLEVSGAVEVEMSSGEAYDSTEKSSDIALATVEIGFDAKINDRVSAHVLMLHEDDDTDPPVIDEGTISITNGPVFINAGRMYIPFGNFESHMVSDPLTLEIAETQEAAIEFGYEASGFRASVYAFNGEADKNEVDNDVVDDFGISIGYTMKAGSANMDLGLDYLNNMAETDAIQEAIIAGPGVVEEHTAGMALHAIFTMDKLNVILEYITASDSFNIADLQFNGAEAEPSASNIEVAYTIDDYTIAIAHQTSDEVDGSALPETRNMISVSTTIAGDVGLAVEYTDADDYDVADGGTGESGGTLTAQLAVEF